MKNRERKGSATVVGGQFRIRKDEGLKQNIQKAAHPL